MSLGTPSAGSDQGSPQGRLDVAPPTGLGRATPRSGDAAPSRGAILLISAVFLVYVWDRVIVPIESVEIRAALSLSLPQIGFLGSVFTFGLVLAALPTGMFAAHYGTRASLILGAVVFSAATLCFGLAESFGLMLLLRIVSGVGEGFYNIALLTFLGRMTRKHRSLAVGFPATLFGCGLFTGPPVIAGLLALSGTWWPPFIILGLSGLLGTVAIWMLLGNDRAPRGSGPSKPALSEIAAVLTPGTIAIYVTVAATGLIAYSYISLMQGYLRSDSGLSPGEARTVFSLFGIGSALGGIGMGALGDLVGRGRFVTGATVVVALVGACVFWAPPSLLLSGALSLAVGAGTNGIYCNSIALVQDRAGHERIPLATGMLAIIFYLMSAFSGYLVAKLAIAVGWMMTGLLAYTAPYLLVAPCLFALVWRAPAAAESGAFEALDEGARH